MLSAPPKTRGTAKFPILNNVRFEVNKNLTNIQKLYNRLAKGDLGRVRTVFCGLLKNSSSNAEDCRAILRIARNDIETYLFFERNGSQGRPKKVLLAAVMAWANSGRGICFSSATKPAVWIIRAGSLVFCLRIGSGDM